MMWQFPSMVQDTHWQHGERMREISFDFDFDLSFLSSYSYKAIYAIYIKNQIKRNSRISEVKALSDPSRSPFKKVGQDPGWYQSICDPTKENQNPNSFANLQPEPTDCRAHRAIAAIPQTSPASRTPEIFFALPAPEWSYPSPWLNWLLGGVGVAPAGRVAI